MFARRSFLIGTLGATLAASSRLTWATSAPARAVRVVVDGACADARGFALACGLVDVTHRDAAALAEVLDGMDEDACLGLARDSQSFVLTRLLEARRYRTVYRGEHRYERDRVSHRLRGTSNAVATLACALRDAGAAWPQCLASAAPLLAHDTHLEHAAGCELPLRAPSDSAGLLVSWCLLRR